MKRLAILASGSGSNAQALIDATRAGDLAAEIVAVISDRPDAPVLRRAARAAIPAVALPLQDRHDPGLREAYDGQLADVVAAFRPDLVVLAGWMLVLTPAFLDRFPGRVVNVHPALLPDGGGETVATTAGPLPVLRGARTVRDALRRGLPLTGATVHYVTEIVDDGPVLLREEVPISPDDDETSLHERIKRTEHQLLPRAVALALGCEPPQRRKHGR